MVSFPPANRLATANPLAASRRHWRLSSFHLPVEEQGLFKPKRHSICVSEGEGDTEMENLNCSALVPVEMPVGLTHLDSDLCWCDPIVEVDEDGEHVLLHRQVTWN